MLSFYWIYSFFFSFYLQNVTLQDNYFIYIHFFQQIDFCVFQFRNWRWPRVSRRDKCLHTTFVITLIMMAACAVATVLCFLSDNGQAPQKKSQLSLEEIVTLVCGVLFFVSFFLAMTVEIKARHTVYRLLQKFIIHNTEWQIEPYDKAKDPGCPKPYLYVWIGVKSLTIKCYSNNC